MGRLRADGETRFVILDHEPIYSDPEFDRICERHSVSDTHRASLKLLLEQIGRIYLDQMQLNGRPAQTLRLRQELRKGLCLLTELLELTPDMQRQSMLSEVAHASALREGERQLQEEDKMSAPGLLSDARVQISYMRDVYEAALESAVRCARGPSERHRIVARWRSAMIEFYTRTLNRPWIEAGSEQEGERFLADCQCVLEETELIKAEPTDAAEDQASGADPVVTPETVSEAETQPIRASL